MAEDIWDDQGKDDRIYKWSQKRQLPNPWIKDDDYGYRISQWNSESCQLIVWRENHIFLSMSEKLISYWVRQAFRPKLFISVKLNKYVWTYRGFFEHSSFGSLFSSPTLSLLLSENNAFEIWKRRRKQCQTNYMVCYYMKKWDSSQEIPFYASMKQNFVTDCSKFLFTLLQK